MTIKERASVYHYDVEMKGPQNIYDAYEKGATDQKKIDIEKACDWLGNYGLSNIMIATFRRDMEMED